MKKLMLCALALLFVSCATKEKECGCEKKPVKKEHECKRCGSQACPN